MSAKATESVGGMRFVGENVAPHDLRFANSDLSLDEAVKDILESQEDFTLPNLDILKHIGAPKGTW